MSDLTVTVIQADLHWEDVTQNLSEFDKKLRQIEGQTDLILLPEMFNTGFTMQPEILAEPMMGRTMSFMAQHAKRLNATVAGSLAIGQNGDFFNRLVLMRPNGTYDIYDKRHLFGMGGENKHFTAGSERLIVELKGWSICPLICYDLRFPTWARNTVDYDLLIFVANWPEMRSLHWKTLLAARAIENQCYTIGVNRVGTDGNGVYHSGDSCVINPMGTTVWQQSHQQGVFTMKLSKLYLQKVRESLPFLSDRDNFKLD